MEKENNKAHEPWDKTGKKRKNYALNNGELWKK
jgi:hypothetical protein